VQVLCHCCGGNAALHISNPAVAMESLRDRESRVANNNAVNAAMIFLLCGRSFFISVCIQVCVALAICLLNVSFKIFTKVATIRLNTVADVVVRPSQTAFMQGRNILDGVVTLHETVHELHSKKLNGVLLKLDFEKAYDKVKSQPEINPMPCAVDTRRNSKSTRQILRRVFALGKQDTATNATANCLCRAHPPEPTAKLLPCAAAAHTGKKSA
jgi:hypothetical protein